VDLEAEHGRGLSLFSLLRLEEERKDEDEKGVFLTETVFFLY
jgi:hypothetical protein